MRLIDWLQKHGVRQKELAESLGISYPTVHRIAHGKTFPQAALAKNIFEHTNGDVTANDLLNTYLEQAGTPLKSPKVNTRKAD